MCIRDSRDSQDHALFFLFRWKQKHCGRIDVTEILSILRGSNHINLRLQLFLPDALNDGIPVPLCLFPNIQMTVPLHRIFSIFS